jgi:hypothetical protein
MTFENSESCTRCLGLHVPQDGELTASLSLGLGLCKVSRIIFYNPASPMRKEGPEGTSGPQGCVLRQYTLHLFALESQTREELPAERSGKVSQRK